MKGGFVYIVASQKNGTIYTGVTSDLPKRIYEHREGLVKGFTKEYGCKLLVWFEAHDDLQEARRRELQIKEWKRAWKIRLIEERNLTGKISTRRCSELFPGEGRGPGADGFLMTSWLSNPAVAGSWAPAFAGEQYYD